MGRSRDLANLGDYSASSFQIDTITDTSGGNTTSINSTTPTANTNVGKNKIINGAMMIDQRNNGASVANTTSPLYTIDRWKFYSNVATKLTAERSTVAPAGFYNSIKITSTSAYTSAAGNRFVWYQVIEGVNTSDLLWGTANAKTVTLSFWVRSSLTGTFSGDFHNPAGNPSYVFTFNISSADTWEKKTITVPGPTTGTWNTGTTSGSINVSFNLGDGSNYLTSTTNTWQSAFYEGATGSVSLVGTSGATLYITGVQLEVGSVATEFEHRQYGTELALCQRYYEKSYPDDVNPGTSGSAETTYFRNYNASTTLLIVSTPFKVKKRATPTVQCYDSSGNAGKIGVNDNITDPNNQAAIPSSLGVFGMKVQSNSGSSINGMRYLYTADSEL